ncbi:MAG: hypothetical protein J6U91_05600 [Alistipes sp.]|nr:hypothetical protein [Alistipes sp.]
MKLDIERILRYNNMEMSIGEIKTELLIIGDMNQGLYDKIYYHLTHGGLCDKVVKTKYPTGCDKYQIF